MTAGWPTGVNLYAITGTYQEKPDRNVASFQPEVGPSIDRRRMSISSNVLSFSTRMKFSEYETFLTWYRNTIKDGSLPFYRPRPRDGFIEQFKFTGDDAPQAQDMGYNLLEVQMSMKSIPNTKASWLPLLSNSDIVKVPSIFADFTTEGSADPHYWYAGDKYASFASWLNALGGTYSRASTATYMKGGVVFSALSNAPRFPTDLTGNPTGIRLTGAGINKATDSNFQNISWSWANATLAANTTDTTAPDGTNRAGKVTDNNTNTTHDIYLTMASGATISAFNTFSVFMKKATATKARLIIFDTGTGFVQIDVDLNAGTVSNLTSSLMTSPSAAIQTCANGWYRISISAIWTAVALTNFLIRMGNGSSFSYAGAGSSYYVWGAEIDPGIGFATDYVPTTTVALTQAADSLSFPYNLRTLSTFINTINQQNVLNFSRYLGTDDSVGFEALIFHDDTYTKFGTFNGSSFLERLAASSPINNHKIMLAGGSTGRALSADGATPVSDNNSMLPNAYTKLTVGSPVTYGDFKSLAIWNNIVASSADLVRLTT